MTDAKEAGTPPKPPQSPRKRPSGRRLPKPVQTPESPAAGIVAPSAPAPVSGPTVEKGENDATSDDANGPELTDKLAESLCNLIANGATERSATLVLRQSGQWPGTHDALMGRMRRHHRDRLADAHERCAVRWLEELEELGRTGRLRGEDGDRQDPRVVATRIASLQWLLSKKDRARWGDKREEAPQDAGPQVTVVLADARALARDVEGDPPALPASQVAARRLARGPR